MWTGYPKMWIVYNDRAKEVLDLIEKEESVVKHG